MLKFVGLFRHLEMTVLSTPSISPIDLAEVLGAQSFNISAAGKQ